MCFTRIVVPARESALTADAPVSSLSCFSTLVISVLEWTNRIDMASGEFKLTIAEFTADDLTPFLSFFVADLVKIDYYFFIRWINILNSKYYFGR